jgi:uncharacterized protein (DUF1800 family)
MEILLLGIYSFFVWLIFFKFWWLPWTIFSLGGGNYTETDVREAARAVTGWDIGGSEFLHNYALHYDGDKTLFGRTGNFAGDAVVDILL